MAYEPIAQIPLEDLAATESTDFVGNDSDSSILSGFFFEIDHHECDEDQKQDFLSDPDFQTQLQNFIGTKTLRKLLFWLLFAFVFLLWATGLVVYSTGNIRHATLNMWHGGHTNLISLSDRNLSLNSFLPQHSNLTFENYRKATFINRRRRVDWLRLSQFPQSKSNYANGFYLTETKHGFSILQQGTDYEYQILKSLQFSYGNTFFYAEDIYLNPGTAVDDDSVTHILISNVDQQWRNSQFAIYWIWLPATETVFPIQPPGAETSQNIEKLHFVKFDPAGKYVVFGHNHDLYLFELKSGKTTRITSNGSPDIFNGKPDFVYEEEVVAGDHMVWWCPDLSNFIFATLNDTLVEDFKLNYFVKDPEEITASYQQSKSRKVNGVNQYPIQTSIKYPKPGTNLPIVTLAMYNISLKELASLPGEVPLLGNEYILYRAQWIDQNNFLVKLADRTSTKLSKRVFKPLEWEFVDVSCIDTSDFGGWIEKTPPVVLIPNKEEVGYTDKVVVDGLVQLVFYELPTSSNYSRVLGPVSYGSPVIYDAVENAVYGLFGTDLNLTFAAVHLGDHSFKLFHSDGDYLPRFSPDGQFVDLEYCGPQTPWQKLINMAEINSEFNLDDMAPLNDQSRLIHAIETTNLPTRVYSKVKVDDGNYTAELNMIEIFPPNFNSKLKHPLLVHVYGGPGSAIVDKAFKVEFEDIVCSEMNAVVLIIDPRGTSPDNWKFKSSATSQLGFWEPRDLVMVTKDYINTNNYVDKMKTAIWGWSYGGFSTLKTLEFDKGEIFKYGAAVAPVSNWLFYDAIYTERYMKSVDNPNYSAISRINAFENFKTVKRFLLMHGSADDNVHLQNTMWLLDNFDLANVENYDVHIFPDSDHSIYYHNANDMVYDRLFWWLQKAFNGFYE